MAIDVHTHIVPADFPAYAGRAGSQRWPQMHACDHPGHRDRRHWRQAVSDRQRPQLGRRPPPGGHAGRGRADAGSVADAGVVVVLVRCRRRAGHGAAHQRHHRRHGGGRSGALRRPGDGAAAGSRAGRQADADAAPRLRPGRRGGRQQHQRQADRPSGSRAVFRRGGGKRPGRVRARAAPGRRGSGDRPAAAAGADRVSERERVCRGVHDHRRPAGAVSRRCALVSATAAAASGWCCRACNPAGRPRAGRILSCPARPSNTPGACTTTPWSTTIWRCAT